MTNKIIFFTGILGVTLFAIASILGGFQFENYSPVSQLISESMAVDTPYGKTLRYFGYIPSGILLTIFAFSAIGKFPESKLIRNGFVLLGIFYGIGTVIVGIFPCDKGCNKELVDPSVSQIIHNLSGLLTYIFVPISIFMIGTGLRKLKIQTGLSNLSLICGIICIFFIGLLFSSPETQYAGLYQRIIEGAFIVWIIGCANAIKNN